MSNVQSIFAHLQNRRDGIADRPHPLVTHFRNPPASTLPDNDNEVWVPTSESTASRAVARRSTSHCVGKLVDVEGNRAIQCESKLEMDAFKVLQCDRSIATIHEQPKRLAYVDREGNTCHHTPDLLAVMKDGRRISYDVKPSRRVESSGIKEILRLVHAQNPGFAHKYVLVTEKEITSARVARAEWILWARSARNDHHVETLMKQALTLKGSSSMRALAEASGLGPHAFRTLVNLIDDGVLQLVGSMPIGDRALIQLNPEYSR
jgi:hypothetical protein